jgi:hypothetical protein
MVVVVAVAVTRVVPAKRKQEGDMISISRAATRE